ncbi:hypothetical protein IW140_002618 [Coemansia sp. RSA 1813]|nr:hypothetical protein EV178_002054 [Coemansia sp. RSA 1646]KAJ1772683.1 hypothetical protein LPJ74_001209 [Coemansia sp. RSA 1843]KAJ2090634.1 hypothetical protein IW138_002448 [Coemansia sp. RSA 986]KAJ2216161.1 hypothetical protein EV179_001621 [Coemansia sp. RSA 487]KAJ2570148.1 hypothetical protein IW140_002618 [Coemansia sp. RSA 1813]
MIANENAADVLAPEPLPPYTLMEESQFLSTEAEQEVLPPEFEYRERDNRSSTAVDKDIFDTIQCIETTNTMTFVFEGIKGAHVSVCTDDRDKYSGYVCVQTRCAPRPTDGGKYPIPTVSVDDDNEGCTIATFKLDPGHTSQRKRRELRSEYRITIPHAGIQVLKLRLSEDSHFDMRECAVMEGLDMDVALVEGSVALSQISAQAVRVAIKSGTISARGVRLSANAQFIAMRGRIHVEDASSTGIRINAPDATVDIDDSYAHDISVKTQTAAVSMRRVRATDTMDVSSGSGSINLEDVASNFLTVMTDTAPVSGVWTIGEQLKVLANTAVVNGRLRRPEARPAGCECTIRTRGMPIHLQVDADFAGSFDLRANGSVTRFDLATQNPYTSFSQYFLSWMQGSVWSGAAIHRPYTLFIENENAPIVITS